MGYIPLGMPCRPHDKRHGHRPFAVVFGRQANSFADYSNATIPAEFQPSSEAHERVIADIQRRVKTMQEELFPGVASKSQATADKAAKAFNKKHRTIDIPEGTFVMVRDRQRKSKLAPTNVGPYKVIGKTRGGSYVLRDSEGQLLPHNFPPSALIHLSTDPSFEQESYEIDAILDHHEDPEHPELGMRYLVRWKNYAPEHDTWEPESHFNDHGVIDEYWSRRGVADT